MPLVICEAVQAKIKEDLYGGSVLRDYEFLLIEVWEKCQMFQVLYGMGRGEIIEPFDDF